MGFESPDLPSGKPALYPFGPLPVLQAANNSNQQVFHSDAKITQLAKELGW